MSKEAHAHDRNDIWRREVAFRTNLEVSDLHAADTRDYIANFFTNRPSESSAEVCDSALDKLVAQMSLDFTRIWNSVELYSLYNELGGTLCYLNSTLIFLFCLPLVLPRSWCFEVKHQIICAL